jgi:RNA polymerase sigma-70 factor (ECF subfamily)
MTGFTNDQLLACTPNLRQYAKALCRSRPEQIDDLVQATLLCALDKRHLWVEQGSGSLNRWLGSLLHNTYVNSIRRAVRSPVDAAAPEERLYQHPVRGQQEDRVKFNEMRRELAKMSPEQQHAIVLVGVEGLPYEKAADVLNIPPRHTALEVVAWARGAGRGRVIDNYAGYRA